MKNSELSESIFQKRQKRFKSMKRGYYSFIILLTLYLLSFLNPLLVNNKALIVKYNNEYYFPVAKYYASTTFGQKGYGETQYRELDKQFKNDDSGIITEINSTSIAKGLNEILKPKSLIKFRKSLDISEKVFWFAKNSSVYP